MRGNHLPEDGSANSGSKPYNPEKPEGVALETARNHRHQERGCQTLSGKKYISDRGWKYKVMGGKKIHKRSKMPHKRSKMPHKRSKMPEGVAVELADFVIRILDYCGHAGIDIEEAIRIKHTVTHGKPHLIGFSRNIPGSRKSCSAQAEGKRGLRRVHGGRGLQ